MTQAQAVVSLAEEPHAKDVIWFFFARALPAAVALGTLVVFARLLSPDHFGYYTLITSAGFIGHSVLLEWNTFPIVRLFPSSDPERVQYLSTVAGLFGLLAIAAVVVVTLVLIVCSGIDRPALGWMIAGGIVFATAESFHNIVLNIARAEEAVVRYGVLATVRAVMVFAIGTALIYLQFEVAGAIVGSILATVATDLLLVPRRLMQVRPRHFDRARAREQVSFGVPLSAAVMFQWVMYRFDRFYVASVFGAAAAGMYGAVSDLAQRSLGQLNQAIYFAFFPKLVGTWDGGHTAVYRRIVANHTSTLIGIGLPAAVGLAVVAPAAIPVLFGDAYSQLPPAVLALIALATVFESIKIYCLDLAFWLNKKTNVIIIVNAICAIANVALNYLLVHQFQLIGAAAALMITFVFANLVTYALSRNVGHLWLNLRELARIIVAIAAMLLVLLALQTPTSVSGLIAEVTAGALTYAAACFALDVAGSRAAVRVAAGRLTREPGRP